MEIEGKARPRTQITFIVNIDGKEFTMAYDDVIKLKRELSRIVDHEAEELARIRINEERERERKLMDDFRTEEHK